MKVEFRTKKLEKQYLKQKTAEQAYGNSIAKKYIGRVNIIKSAKNIEDLRGLPGLNCEPLKGNWKGFWSIRLTGFYRLIFTLHGKHLEIVQIEEVSKHYDD